MTDVASRPVSAPEITYRRARMEDAERTFEIVQEAQGDLDRRMGRVPLAALPAPRVIRFLHFSVRYDGGLRPPDRSRVLAGRSGSERQDRRTTWLGPGLRLRFGCRCDRASRGRASR